MDPSKRDALNDLFQENSSWRTEQILLKCVVDGETKDVNVVPLLGTDSTRRPVEERSYLYLSKEYGAIDDKASRKEFQSSVIRACQEAGFQADPVPSIS